MRIRSVNSSVGSFLLALSLATLLPAIARASGSDSNVEGANGAVSNPAPVPAAKPRADETKKVYTNDDFGWYSPSASSVSSAPASQSDQATAASTDESAESGSDFVPPDPHQDPQWYAQQVTAIESDLAAVESRETALQQFRDTSTGLPTGLNISEPTEGVNTDDYIAQLDSHRQDLEQQLDALSDLARENGLPPGTVNQPAVAEPPAPTLADQQIALTMAYRNTTDQLAETQAALDGMQQQAAAQNITLIPPTAGEGGNPTTNLITNLNDRVDTLQTALSDAEDNARTLGVVPGDLR